MLCDQAAAFGDTRIANAYTLGHTTITGTGVVTLGGCYNPGDGGGGILYPIASGCTADNGTILQDCVGGGVLPRQFRPPTYSVASGGGRVVAA